MERKKKHRTPIESTDVVSRESNDQNFVTIIVLNFEL